ncbi:MAG: LysE family transporter [Firmicutes bacterium]|nr:LysE family transporter [Bacillota bacterium]
MELYMIFFTAMGVGLSGAVMPGPVTAVVAEQTIKRGFIAAPLVVLGHGILEVFVVIMLSTGWGHLVTGETATGVIGIIGGGVLAWMGGGMVRNAPNVSLDAQNTNHVYSKTGPVIAGMITTLANPYWFLWWATIGASYVAFSLEYGARGVILFFSGHILSDLIWLSLLGFALVSGKKFISDRIYRGIIFLLGFFLVGLAAYFIWTGIKFLF